MTDGLHILQVNYADFGGGAEGSAYNLFKEYQRRGVDSWLAVGTKFSAEDGILQIPNQRQRPLWTQVCRSTQIKLKRDHAVAARIIGVLAWLGEPKRCVERSLGIEDFNYPATWDLLSLPPRRPDILHCHNLGAYFDLRALPWLSHQLPVILNLRDAWMLSGHCGHSLDCERWRTGCGHCPDLTIHPAVPRDATAYNWKRKKDIYDRSLFYITAPSQWMIDRQRSSMLQGVQSVVIPNGIDTQVFTPSDKREARQCLNLPLDDQIILITAHNYFKDLPTMEAALARLRAPAGGKLVCYCLGLNGTEKRLGQTEIHFIGFQRDQLRLAKCYIAADVYLHASYGEVFGKTIVEAMACGTPVVAGATGGIPEVITHGIDGFLAAAKNPGEMAKYIETLLQDEVLRRRMGFAGSQKAKMQYNLPLQADRFLKWYAEILEDWKSRRQSAPVELVNKVVGTCL